jgi:hypothetical protein
VQDGRIFPWLPVTREDLQALVEAPIARYEALEGGFTNTLHKVTLITGPIVVVKHYAGGRKAFRDEHATLTRLAGILPVPAVVRAELDKKAIVYKYGGSDAARHHLGIVPFLFWGVIQAAKSQGFEQLDLGRSDVDQPGLVAFKDHLGATRASLTYYTSAPRGRSVLRDGPISRAARRLVAHLPDSALDLTGRLLYKHLG